MGNDIGPQTSVQMLLCTVLLIVGELVLSTVMSAIIGQSEFQERKKKELTKKMDYVLFSLNLHDIPE